VCNWCTYSRQISIPLSTLKRPWFYQFATFLNSYLCFI
jgi:hypothetical protein